MEAGLELFSCLPSTGIIAVLQKTLLLRKKLVSFPDRVSSSSGCPGTHRSTCLCLLSAQMKIKSVTDTIVSKK